MEAARAEAEQLKEEIAQARNAANDTSLDAAAKSSSPAAQFSVKTRQILSGHFGKVQAAHWSRSGEQIVTASQDSTLVVWNAMTAKKTAWVLLASAWPLTCAFSPSGNLIASGGLDNTCTVYNLSSRDNPIRVPTCELQGHDGYLSGCRFVDEKHIITGSGDKTCILWDLETKKPIKKFDDNGGDIACLELSPTDERSFATGSVDSEVKLWDSRQGKCTHTFKGHEADVNTVSFFPTGLQVISGSDDCSCRLFDIRAYRELKSYSPATKAVVTGVATSRSGRYIFAASAIETKGRDSNEVISRAETRVFDTLKGSVVQAFSEDSRRISTIGVSPDGRAICTAGWDNMSRIWA